MARPMWSGTVSFGMVSIPVKLTAATSARAISFKLIHNKCLTPIEEHRFCPQCEKELAWEDVSKGYELEDKQYLELTKDDFEKLPLPSKNVLDVEAFFDISQIDPIYYDHTYYIEPDKRGRTPYLLLRDSLKKKNMIALGTITLRTRERMCIIRPMQNFLVVETLLYPDEIKSEEPDLGTGKAPSAKEMKIAENLIDLMAGDFDPEEHVDHYNEALEKLIQQKLKSGKKTSTGSGKKSGASKSKVIDLMDALQRSINSIEKKGKSTTVRKTSVRAKAKPKSSRASGQSVTKTRQSRSRKATQSRKAS